MAETAVETAALSWALPVDTLNWNFLADKPPSHEEVSFIEG